jgi:hypothetical protein
MKIFEIILFLYLIYLIYTVFKIIFGNGNYFNFDFKKFHITNKKNAIILASLRVILIGIALISLYEKEMIAFYVFMFLFVFHIPLAKKIKITI